jgi:hypothetical protein
MNGSLLGRTAVAVSTVTLSLVVTSLVLEIGLRLFWDGYYVKLHRMTPRGHVDFHPTRGSANVPNASVEYGVPEFRTMLVHNSLGFRNREVEPEKAPGTTRILTLGDSMAYGIGVENDETFSARMEQLDPRIEVINAGASGYHPGQQLLLLEEQGLALAPDLVLIAYFWNDLVDAYRDQYTRFTVDNGSLQLHAPSPPTREHPAFSAARERRKRAERDYKRLRGRSYLYRFVSDRLKILRPMLREELGTLEDRNVYVTPAELEPAWELSFALVLEIANVARAAGAQPVLVVLPDQVQVEPDVDVVGIDDSLLTVQERLLPFAREHGIPAIDLKPDLREIRAGNGVPLYHRYDRHWNVQGHREAASLILSELRAMGLVPPRAS